MLLTQTNLADRIAAGVALPHDVDEALAMLDTGTVTAGEVSIRKGSRGRTNVRSGDFYIVARGGGAGLGDPLERQPEAVKEDVEGGQLSAGAAARIYGVALECDPVTRQWRVDDEATSVQREGVPEERKRRAQPFRQWWQTERKKIMRGDVPEIAQDLYRECMAISDKFNAEFDAFWQLPDAAADRTPDSDGTNVADD
jgi:acetone carboxylase alpha subunit